MISTTTAAAGFYRVAALLLLSSGAVDAFSITALQLTTRSSPQPFQTMRFVSTIPPPEDLLSSSSSSSSGIERAAATTTTTTPTTVPISSFTTDMPPRDPETGVWNLATPTDHTALMEQSSDKLVILKVFAPWCRACKGLDPKFVQLSRDAAYSVTQDGSAPLPIEWASLSIQHNKAFVQSLGVLALPTIQFYVGGKLLDTFPCGPSKVPMLKRKLSALILDHVTLDGVLKPMSVSREEAEEAAAFARRNTEVDPEMVDGISVAGGGGGGATTVAAPKTKITLTETERATFRNIPYFAGMSLADMDQVLDQAVELSFSPGSILVREGKPGRTFYVIKSGEVEICQQTWSYAQYGSDPMVQSSTPRVVDTASSGAYLGSVVNRLGPGDHFGERALITGEPRAASLRAAEDEPVTLWAIDQDCFPYSCVLSGKSRNTAQPRLMDLVNDKYGVDGSLDQYHQQVLNKQTKESATASQVRGSIHTPSLVVGLDDAESEGRVELEEYMDDEFRPDSALSSPLVSPASSSTGSIPVGIVVPNDDAIFSLLTRFQMIRHVSTCFRYIQKTRAIWGDAGNRKRRNMLVSRLSATQRTEFSEIFALMDVNQDGCLELNELKRLLESIGDITSDELKSVMNINKRDGTNDCTDQQPATTIDVENCIGPGVMTYEDYMGIMAEAEFYYLFLDIFSSLDEQKSGYVKASDLDRVLCGVRDLISDDRKSVIDVDDKDMLIDYEQFSRMLLGTTLI